MSLGSAQFLDARQSVETLNDLLNLNTNIIPDGFECYVRELDCKYKFNSTYSDPVTGSWKLNVLEGGEKEVQFITEEDYKQLERDGLVEQNKNYYILGKPTDYENEIANLQAQIDELRERLESL